MTSIVFPPNVTKHPDHVEARAFLNSVTPKPGVDYTVALEHAKSVWEGEQKAYELLEAKADSIIRYLGGGTTLFTLGILSKIDASNYWIAVAALVPIAMALVAIRFAVRAMTPAPAPSLPSVQTVKEVYLDATDSEMEAVGALLGQWNLACVDMRLVNELKAQHVTTATAFYFGAIVSLTAPLLAGILLGVMASRPVGGG